MDIANLIHMANRIGEFFESMPDTHEAQEGVAQHLLKFWEPRMRRLLLSQVDADGAPALLPLVRQAIALHRTSLQPTAASATNTRAGVLGGPT